MFVRGRWRGRRIDYEKVPSGLVAKRGAKASPLPAGEGVSCITLDPAHRTALS